MNKFRQFLQKSARSLVLVLAGLSVVAVCNLNCAGPNVVDSENFRLAEAKADRLAELAKDGVVDLEQVEYDRVFKEFQALAASLSSELAEARKEVSDGVNFVKDQGKPFLPAPLSGAADGLVGLGLSLYFALRGDKKQQGQIDALVNRVKALSGSQEN